MANLLDSIIKFIGNRGVFKDVNGNVNMSGDLAVTGNLKTNGHSSEIGAFMSAHLASDTSVTKEVPTAICSITLPAGTWVVVGYAQFHPNSTGVRTMNLHTTSGSNFRQVAVPAANGYTVIQTTIVVKIAESTTYYLNVWHNAGTSLTMAAGTDGGYTNGIRAVRIA